MEASTFYPVVVVLLTAIALFSGHHHRSRCLRRNKPPMVPGALPFVGHLPLLARQSQQPIHRTLADMAAAHGSVLFLRFGSRPVLIVSSPSAAEECLTTNDITFANRPFILSTKYLSVEYSTLTAAPYGPHWRNLRRIAVVELFSSARIQSFAGVRADEVRSLLRSLFHSNSSGTDGWRLVEIRSKLMQLTSNIMTRTIDGRSYFGEKETVAPEEGLRFRRVVEEVFQLCEATCMDDYVPVVKWLGFGGIRKRMIRLGKEMDEIFRDMVEKRRRRRSEMMEAAAEEKTIIDVILTLQEADPENFSDEIIVGMAWVIAFFSIIFF